MPDMTTILLGESAFDIMASKYVTSGEAYVINSGIGSLLGRVVPGSLRILFDRDYRDSDSPIYEELVAELGQRPLPRSPLDDFDELKRQYEALVSKRFPPMRMTLDPIEIVKLAGLH